MSHSSSKLDQTWADTGGPFFPTTGEIGFLEAAQASVVDAFIEWRSKLAQMPVRRVIEGGLADGIRSLLPLTTVDRRRWVFFELGPWTAFFDNGARGTDAGPVASYLAKTMGCRASRAVGVPDGDGRYGATILELYGPERTEFLNYVRAISASNDGGRWRFDTSGTPQAFEDEAAYERRRIKDRFTPQMLSDYLRVMGINAFEPEAYRTPVLVERSDVEPPKMQHLTFEESRARFSPPR